MHKLKLKKSPEFTRKQWIIKCCLIFVSAIGIDLTGVKIWSIDQQLILRQISEAEAHNIFYIYLCVIEGFFIANALWNIFVVYWWGKDFLTKVKAEGMM